MGAGLGKEEAEGGMMESVHLNREKEVKSKGTAWGGFRWKSVVLFIRNGGKVSLIRMEAKIKTKPIRSLKVMLSPYNIMENTTPKTASKLASKATCTDGRWASARFWNNKAIAEAHKTKYAISSQKIGRAHV